MDESKLLGLLKNDPNTGMRKLIEQYAGLVYSVVRGKLAASACTSEIEACVADTFSEFYTALSSYDPAVSSIKSYLCVLARHNALDLLRKADKQRHTCSIDDAEFLLPEDDGETVEELVIESDQRRAVFAAIRDLGEPDSQILIRKYYLGQPSIQIAKALGMSVSAVDTRTHRAINQLRTLFGGKES